MDNTLQKLHRKALLGDRDAREQLKRYRCKLQGHDREHISSVTTYEDHSKLTTIIVIRCFSTTRYRITLSLTKLMKHPNLRNQLLKDEIFKAAKQLARCPRCEDPVLLVINEYFIRIATELQCLNIT